MDTRWQSFLGIPSLFSLEIYATGCYAYKEVSKVLWIILLLTFQFSTNQAHEERNKTKAEERDEVLAA